ncbi:UNVERIFIED_CONTAM: putative pectate lyase 16 [Sesamum latifolium]|uniref:Pectate lyase n=1 Tax=Sesamum latifolium TaxID=2727402 RepID=A0AAW2TQI5_9LAMI
MATNSCTSLFILSWLLAFCISGYMAHTPKVVNKPITTYPRPGTKLMNKIDSCWRSDPNWESNRKALADCAVGFGSNAMGGKNGAIYVVTDPSDDPVNPKPGTLRYGAIQTQPLWIIFERDMVITLENELMMNSYKTIDGRGARVEISNGPCITIEGVSHVIIHGISIHDCKPGKSGMVRSTPDHVGERLGSDGDAISVFASSNVWIDHCYLARCTDGLVDIIHASNLVTVSNNYFTQHDKVMLLGHRDGYTADRIMKVTVVFNHFGPGLVQRMPRVRYGYAHVANNRYDQWIMYAIGGSADPTISVKATTFLLQMTLMLNRLNILGGGQVTKRETYDGWKSWKWRSTKDVFVNGAYFVPSGWGSCAPNYVTSQYFGAAPGSLVPALTSDAGPLLCLPYQEC